MALTIDSYAWIELIRGTPVGSRARVLIDSADRAYTPAVVLAEVAHRCLRDGLPERVVRQELRSISEASMVIPIDITISTAASKATTELRQRARSFRLPLPGLADGLVLATARAAGASLLTGDSHFRDLPETVWLE